MKKVYITYTILYLLYFLFEFYNYFIFNSNVFGMIHLILNLIILFLLVFSSKNYKSKNVRFRVSKNFFLIFIMLFSILILPNLNYIDDSYLYIDSMRKYIYFAQGLFVLLILGLSSLELKIRKNNIHLNQTIVSK